MTRDPGDICAFEQNLASGRFTSYDHFRERRLTRTVGAHDRDTLPSRYDKVDIKERCPLPLIFPIELGDTLKFEHG